MGLLALILQEPSLNLHCLQQKHPLCPPWTSPGSSLRHCSLPVPQAGSPDASALCCSKAGSLPRQRLNSSATQTNGTECVITYLLLPSERRCIGLNYSIGGRNIFSVSQTQVLYTISKCALSQPSCSSVSVAPLKSIQQMRPGLLLLSWKQRECNLQGLYLLTTTN